MKVLIIGASGLLGKELYRDFSTVSEILGTYKGKALKGLVYLDLLEKKAIKECLLGFKPDIILLSAALTGVDFCEQNQDLAWQINVEGVEEVAVLAKKEHAFLAFYSSDYIFDGRDGPYSEEDRPSPINFYGKTKLEAEKIIQKELKHFLIIRTCSLYGYEKGGLNFAMQVWDNLKNNKPMTVPKDQFGTPTYVEDLSRITYELVRDRKEGIFNVVGPDYVNRVEFTSEVADVFGLDKAFIKAVTSEKLKQAAQRPKRGGLKIDKLMREAELKTMRLKEGLLAMKKKVQ